jgi:thiol-disulfide isomerase/thioredoxin
VDLPACPSHMISTASSTVLDLHQHRAALRESVSVSSPKPSICKSRQPSFSLEKLKSQRPVPVLIATASIAIAIAIGIARVGALAAPVVGAVAQGVSPLQGLEWQLSAGARKEARMPQLELRAIDGNIVRLASFAGRPTVVNLWATWCAPCQREMPVLQNAQTMRTDVHFLFVNQGEASQQVAAWLARRGLHLRNVLLDAGSEAGAALGQRALPTTVFFDADGRLIDMHVGELSEAWLAARLAKLPSAAVKK